MRFSEAFHISRGPDDDWFDPHLSIDTKLFLDPLLLYLATDEEWGDVHDELIRHFVHCYRLVARATGPESTSAQAARRLLTFPEPDEFCLGFTAEGTAGAGSGSQYARRMMDGIASAIAAGLRNPEHIEEIGILNEGIGADRISDAVCNVLKHRFIEYTQAVAHRHGLQIDEHRVRNSSCHLEQGRWLSQPTLLPTNPHNGQPILLVPQYFLNDYATLNAEDWFDSNINADLRTQLNLAVGQRVRKEDIVEFARRHPDRVRRWAREQTSRTDITGYNFEDDPKGVVHWDRATREYAEANPLLGIEPPTSPEELKAVLLKVFEQFKRYIEQQRGWSLLWNENGGEKNEEAAQLVFLGIAQNYLRMFDVEIDREVELGRGPVDFKIARGTTCRIIIEVKKAHNGKFWNGLESQLPTYMQSDDANVGWFIAIRYRSTLASQRRMNELPGRVSRLAERSGKRIGYLSVDTRRPVSASQVEGGNPEESPEDS